MNEWMAGEITRGTISSDSATGIDTTAFSNDLITPPSSEPDMTKLCHVATFLA